MARILVVEDDIDICMCLAEILMDAGFETAVATDGLRAYDILENAHPLPDVILLDLRMPNEDGWTLRTKIKNNERLRKIPIIVMSASNLLLDVEADAHLRKPFDASNLLELCESLIH